MNSNEVLNSSVLPLGLLKTLTHRQGAIKKFQTGFSIQTISTFMQDVVTLRSRCAAQISLLANLAVHSRLKCSNS